METTDGWGGVEAAPEGLNAGATRSGAHSGWHGCCGGGNHCGRGDAKERCGGGGGCASSVGAVIFDEPASAEVCEAVVALGAEAQLAG